MKIILNKNIILESTRLLEEAGPGDFMRLVAKNGMKHNTFGDLGGIHRATKGVVNDVRDQIKRNTEIAKVPNDHDGDGIPDLG